jgi:hypothetical protein
VATKRVSVCDRDGSEGDIRRYRVGPQGGSLYTVELCPACAEPLNRLVDEHQKNTKRSAFKVTPIEDVAKAATLRRRVPATRKRRV